MPERRTHEELSDHLARSEAREATSRREAFETGAWLAAIVENSDDAILSKTLDGTIMTWNAGAEKLFGYTSGEMIGRPINVIIPRDRLREEEMIIGALRAGSQVSHFETQRLRKDASLIDIELTVSPVRDEAGRVLGASKIARDISKVKRAAARQDLIIREMNHRIKNLFALTASLVALSARSATDVGELVRDLTARLRALSRAHSLTLPDLYEDAVTERGTTLPALLATVLEPHNDGTGTHIFVTGEPVPVGHHAVPTLGLLFHELATNASKYGALASTAGRLTVTVSVANEMADVQWRETGGPERDGDLPVSMGFGSRLEQASIATLQGALTRHWQADGLEIAIRFPLNEIAR